MKFGEMSIYMDMRANGPEREYRLAEKLKDLEVIKEFFRSNEGYREWPGKHQNVHYWVLLEGNIGVAHNENPSIGWSFPMMKIKEVV